MEHRNQIRVVPFPRSVLREQRPEFNATHPIHVSVLLFFPVPRLAVIKMRVAQSQPMEVGGLLGTRRGIALIDMTRKARVDHQSPPGIINFTKAFRTYSLQP